MGNIVGHEVHVRLMVRTLDSMTGLREVQIEKALDIRPARCEIYLGVEGFTDEPQRPLKRLVL